MEMGIADEIAEPLVSICEVDVNVVVVVVRGVKTASASANTLSIHQTVASLCERCEKEEAPDNEREDKFRVRRKI